MLHDRGMNALSQSGPDPQTITNHIRETYPDAVVLEMSGTWFFSLDEKHFPNFATIVTTDEHDAASNLSRPGVFRLNIGVDRATFEPLVERDQRPDYTVSSAAPPTASWRGVIERRSSHG